MKLKKETLQELDKIMNEEFGTELTSADLERLANNLTGYFGLLFRAEARDKNEQFGNSPASLIDNQLQKRQDEEAKK